MKNKSSQLLRTSITTGRKILTFPLNWKIIFSFLLFFSIFHVFQITAQTDGNDKVQEAYDLRIKGDNNGAITVLEAVVENSPSNALAYFELSRVKPDDNVELLEKAFELDPQNPMYAFELANAYMLKAYIAMMQGKEEESKEPLSQCVESLKKVLTIKPDCKESLMFLVELNLMLDDLSGKEELPEYLAQLKKIDPIYAAHGELIQAGPEEDAIAYWQNYMDKNGKTPNLQIRQGMASLNQGDTDKAEIIFSEVLKGDESRNDLYLQLARGHLYKAMRADQETAKKEMELIKKYINIYLEKETNKVKHLEAWCYGWLSMLERRSGNSEMAQSYQEKAKELDPNFSRATALPQLYVDNPPHEISYKYKSYFTPF